MEPENKVTEAVKTRTTVRRKTDISSALIELLKVKTLITLTITAACVWGFLSDRVSSEVFMAIVSTVLANYFRKGKDE